MRKEVNAGLIWTAGAELNDAAIRLKALGDLLFCAYSENDGVRPDDETIAIIAAMMQRLTEEIISNNDNIMTEVKKGINLKEQPAED